MKTMDEVYSSINKRMEKSTGHTIESGTVLDFYTTAIAEMDEEIYKEIEGSKNPHLYSNLKGNSLDDLGYMHNMPREVGESDNNYLFRLMNWRYTVEASNQNAINSALLNTVNSSYVEYMPLTNGSGTATAYVIPNDYSNETIIAATEEVKNILEQVVSPSIYLEIITPKATPVQLYLHLESEAGDVGIIQTRIEDKIKNYINAIPPKKDLSVGMLNSIGINEPEADYFQVLQLFIDGQEEHDIFIYQGLMTKFILDEIIWV